MMWHDDEGKRDEDGATVCGLVQITQTRLAPTSSNHGAQARRRYEAHEAGLSHWVVSAVSREDQLARAARVEEQRGRAGVRRPEHGGAQVRPPRAVASSDHGNSSAAPRSQRPEEAHDHESQPK